MFYLENAYLLMKTNNCRNTFEIILHDIEYYFIPSTFNYFYFHFIKEFCLKQKLHIMSNYLCINIGYIKNSVLLFKIFPVSGQTNCFINPDIRNNPAI